ncbi:MAG TPA: RdgB/HAM1 family non-canonical purine NTP pyrophosphatase [Patescibacteria group bacterium]|nr:RdgB/HAM1 family non-canonical purine NTP pyrophosphatase [Patescibacteria group bacterium]
MDKIYLATTNKGKLKELQAIIDVPIEPIELDIDEVQSMDLSYVALKKVEEAFKVVKKPVIVDDVGFYIEALNGFPGPFVKYFLDSLTNEGVLRLMENEKNRKVKVAAAIGYHDGKNAHVFIGEFIGQIVSKIRGDKGFGFDPIIIPDGYDKTFAEMDEELKNKISHRGKALEKLKNFLDSQKKQKKI